MSHTRKALAISVAKDLNAIEHTMELAISLSAQLYSKVIDGREAAQLSTVEGQDAFDAIAKTMLVMTNARRELIETHSHLQAVAERMGVDIVGFGYQKPPRAQLVREQHLKAVA